MGLDMYLTAFPAGTENLGNCEFSKEIAYWRKHHDLHGWMARRWLERDENSKRYTADDFNLVYLKLNHQDLLDLRDAVLHDKLPGTAGFFFGNYPPDEESKANDLKIIKDAQEELDKGHVVAYHSWW